MTTMQRQPDDVGAGSEPAKEGEAGLARTDIYDVLSNERRTMVLELLAASDPRDLGDLAEEIAARETGERPPPRNKRTSVYVTLHQTHLPKLATLSIVEYDDREKVVSLGSRASTVLAQQEGGSTESAAPDWRPPPPARTPSQLSPSSSRFSGFTSLGTAPASRSIRRS